MSLAQTEIANGFAREYYTLLYKDVTALAKLYAADATLSHSEEGESCSEKVYQGKEQISAALGRDGFAGSKVVITDVTAIPSQSKVLAVIIGDMKFKHLKPKTFTQTFVLDKKRNGSFALVSDVLKFIRSDGPVEVTHPISSVNGEAKSTASNSSSAEPNNTVPTKQASPQPSLESKPKIEGSTSNVPTASAAATTGKTAPSKKSSKSETPESSKMKFKFDRQSFEKASAFQPPKPTSASPMSPISPAMASSQYIRMAAPYYPDASYPYGYPASGGVPMYIPPQGNPPNFNMAMSYGASGLVSGNHAQMQVPANQMPPKSPSESRVSKSRGASQGAPPRIERNNQKGT